MEAWKTWKNNQSQRLGTDLGSRDDFMLDIFIIRSIYFYIAVLKFIIINEVEIINLKELKLWMFGKQGIFLWFELYQLNLAKHLGIVLSQCSWTFYIVCPFYFIFYLCVTDEFLKTKRASDVQKVQSYLWWVYLKILCWLIDEFRFYWYGGRMG